jgi:hypothetical protein
MQTREVEKLKTIVVWFSCGAASAVAAKKTIELYSDTHKIRIVNNPIEEEDKDNLRFLKDVERWLSHEIEFAINPKYPTGSAAGVWKDKKYMSGVRGAPCTAILKKKARQIWESHNKHDYIVLGFTLDEKKRHDRFVMTERSNVLPVLIDLNLTKSDCLKFIEDAGIRLPVTYELGYANANCIGCVKATSPKYWNLVRRTYPRVFYERAILSREIGAKLVRVKGKRVFLDELKSDDVSGKLKKTECGLFCEEK